MEITNRYEGLDEFSEKTVRIKARQLVRIPGYSADDVEDIEQELAIHLIEQLPVFDPEKAKWETFVNNILDSRIKDLLKYHFAESRNALEFERSLNELLLSEDFDGIEFVETINENDLPWNKHLSKLTDFDTFEFRTDFIEAFKKLPPRLQQLLIHLAKDNVSDISRKSGIPRGTLYEHIKELKKYLSDAGLENYF